MEPIPETVRAIEELGPFADGDELLEELREIGRRVSFLVPDCIGLSLDSAHHGVTFTLVVPAQQLAVLDALRELARESDPRPGDAGGPGAADDLLDEEGWCRLALSSAAPAVASTLTLPVMSASRLAGAVTVYGASRQAFAGHHDQLAEIMGAWAPGAVTNADLSFETRRDAEQAPHHLREISTIDRAAAHVAAAQQVPVEIARRRLGAAARRAGISEAQLAEAVLQLGWFP